MGCYYYYYYFKAHALCSVNRFHGDGMYHLDTFSIWEADVTKVLV
jgi:hypothetical protein